MRARGRGTQSFRALAIHLHLIKFSLPLPVTSAVTAASLIKNTIAVCSNLKRRCRGAARAELVRDAMGAQEASACCNQHHNRHTTGCTTRCTTAAGVPPGVPPSIPCPLSFSRTRWFRIIQAGIHLRSAAGAAVHIPSTGAGGCHHPRPFPAPHGSHPVPLAASSRSGCV